MKYLLIAVFIFYVISLSLGSSSEFPSEQQDSTIFPYLAERPLTEDGFYSLKIAWNIGSGKGITYNYNLQTTGFQPLYVFLLSGFAYLTSNLGGDKITFLRIVILLSGIIALILTYLFFYLIKKLEKNIDTKTLFIVTSLLVLFNFKLFLNLFNGLETGFYLLLMVISVIQTQRIVEGNKSVKQFVLFGLILGLTVLARNDFILLALIIILSLIISRTIRVKDSILILLILFFTILPWFVFVYSVQGSLIPTSASVQTGLTNNEIYYRVDQFLYSLFSSYIPFIHSGQTQSLLIYIMVIPFGFFLYKYHLLNIKKYFGLQVIRIFFVAILVISFVYLFFASQPYFFFRYLSIHMVIAIPIFTLIISKYLANKSAVFKKIFIYLVLGIFAVNIGYYFHYPKTVNGLALRTSFINNNKLEKEKIGMAQSGISGYFFDNIVNLDGKVNNDALLAIRSDSLYEYIVREKINVLIEWREWFQNIDSAILRSDWQRGKANFYDNRTIVFIKKNTSGLLTF